MAQGLVEILAGIGVYFGGTVAEAVGLFFGLESAGTSAIAGIAVADLSYAFGGSLVIDGVRNIGTAIVKTNIANGKISLNTASNYDSWQANKPTSKTFGTVEGKVKGKKANIRVDAEPHSGKVQIQSGGGKSGYRVNAHRGMDKIVDAASAREWIDDISELNKLSNYEKNQLVKYIVKAVKWLKS